MRVNHFYFMSDIYNKQITLFLVALGLNSELPACNKGTLLHEP
jgi:hypothetical protein